MKSDHHVRAVCASARLGDIDVVAWRALRSATHLLAISIGIRLGELRELFPSPAQAHARAEEHSYQLDLAWQAVEILSARFGKLPEHRRPHYGAEQRFAILRIKDSLLLSAHKTARRFALSPATVYRWEAEGQKHPECSTIGSLIRPVPPVRRYADVVRHLVMTVSRAGLGGAGKIAEHFARAGWRISKRTVARYRHEKARGPSAPLLSPTKLPSHLKPISATKPLDKVVVDTTTVRALFGLATFHVALALDVHSRFPLAFRSFRSEPSAMQMIELLEEARQHGRIRVLVSDHGAAFTAALFRRAAMTLGIDHRFGAVHSPRSTALIERLWKTLKGSLGLVLIKPLVLRDLERRIRLGLLHYTFFRPHQALRGATPAEVFLRLPAAHLAAVPPPRGRPGEVVPFPEYEVRYLDAERRLPVLRRKTA